VTPKLTPGRFLLDADGYHTIDFAGAQFTIATGLNPQGEVVGWSRDAAGLDHGYVLRP
jgi:hypothetical protein